ncbi:CPBP family intramembrane glutamic endopeptidase [Desertihabitans aurantiacus]|uniref:CPBP family intramembrane glutamic endopeptidase n=1 Tax=Desertihabitans aurantiacus TaxID=2282477 RepID=UPI000DF84B3B|nr:CPBP family intramembrane glutamic endopeptidase [Desertihabitans aurantiacus]
MTTTAPGTDPGWLIAPTGPGSRAGIPAGVEYHRVLAGERRRIGRGILAIVLLAAGLVAFPTLIGLAVGALEVAAGVAPAPGRAPYSPSRHAGAMVGVALLLPWSLLLQRWLYGVPAASLHSVVSRVRLDVLARALLLLGPPWLLVTAVTFLLVPAEQVPWTQGDLVLMLLATVLLTPLQAAGEEYGVHGLMLRVLGGWTRGARAGLVLAVVVSTVLFTAVHGATDPYVVLWYLVLFGGLALITWRTGGLEVAVVLHAVLNTATLVLGVALHTDIGAALGSRASVSGASTQLVPTVAVVVLTALVWWSTRRSGPLRTPPAGERG